MGKANLARFANNVRGVLHKHTPGILTGIGIAGMVTTTIMAVKATPKALKKCEEVRQEIEEPTKIDYVKATWRCYIPAAITGSLSAACLIGASSVSARRNAAFMTAYNISRTALTEYKEKVVETIGEKKEQLVRDKIAEDKFHKDSVENHEVIVTGRGNTLCYDMMFGRYFRSDLDLIGKAINRINREVVSYGYVSLNDFYDEVDLEPVIMGSKLGWNFDDGEIKIEPGYGRADNDEPCITISFNVPPHYGFDSFN